MKKKVLILGHSDATQFIDIYNQYSSLFSPAHFEVTIAYLTGQPRDKTKQRTQATEVIFLDIPKKQLRYLKLLPVRRLLKLCRESQFDIIICHRYKPTYIMLWVSRFYKAALYLFVMHELKTMSAVGRRFLIALFNRSNMLFAGVSNAVREDLQKKLWGVPKEHIITLYNMLDTEATETALLERAQARKFLHLGEDVFLFGNVARLVPNKDQEGLIQAFSLIKPSCPRAKLIIIGDGVLEDRLKEQANLLGLNADVIFTGFLPNAFQYMKALDCFVLSSAQEAFGRVLLEAMVAKLPIIATKANGIPEVMSDAGFLIEPRDRNALSNAMQEIYHADINFIKGLGEKAYQRVFSQFSLPQFNKIFWQIPLIQNLAGPKLCQS